MVLCLSLTTCSGSDDTVDETVGENWAAFYRDEPEQILFDSVSFPMTISDAQEYFDGISFDDINGDGESDVTVTLLNGHRYISLLSISMVFAWTTIVH